MAAGAAGRAVVVSEGIVGADGARSHVESQDVVSESAHPFLQRLAQGPLLTDGAMGTLLYSRGIGYDQCFDALCETNPELVRGVHADYIEAGAELIETNTFGANAFRLAEHGLGERVRAINLAGARLAREAADASGRKVWVAGSVGPLGVALAPVGELDPADARAVFAAQIQALAEGGVDLIVIETMRDVREAIAAIEAARATCDLPVVALSTFGEDGLTATGLAPEAVVRALETAGADVVGANCSTGPAPMLDVMTRMAAVARVPLAAIPNAGLPTLVAGRYIYTSSPAYMAEVAGQMIAAGVRIVGGCCGTTPEHIGAMHAGLAGGTLHTPRLIFPAAAHVADGGAGQITGQTMGEPTGEPSDELAAMLGGLRGPTTFQRALGTRFVVCVTVDPPRGFNAGALLARLRRLVESGLVDAIDVADSPQARAHVSALAMSVLIQGELGVEAVLNLGCRYRNLVAIHSELMGAHALGVRNILGIMGALPAYGDYPDATVVHDITDGRLIALLAELNRGHTLGGQPATEPAAFHIGCQLALGALDLDRELAVFEAKVAAGAQFAFTDPIFDPRRVDEALRHFGGRFPIPVLAGILPLWNARHAAYLHNEVPGIEIPDAILARMQAAGDDGRAAGVAVAAETLAALGDAVAGVRLMPPSDRFGVVEEILAAALVPG
jgi:methionine synthase I (cobalamin-dependent)/5,10-methylenetetrahydrofolate reductase